MALLLFFQFCHSTSVQQILDDTTVYEPRKVHCERTAGTIRYPASRPKPDMPALQSLKYGIGLEKHQRAPDERKVVSRTDLWPDSCVVHLGWPHKDGIASGIMVGPQHVLTCAHNIYSKEDNTWDVEGLKIVPGLGRNTAPFTILGCSRIFTFDEYIQAANETDPIARNFDLALLILDYPIGYYTGWAGMVCLPDNNLTDIRVRITGYPGDKGGVTPLTMETQGLKFSEDRLSYFLYTWPGNSGSGICTFDEENPYVLGVHTWGDGIHKGDGRNSGVRLSRQKLDMVLVWIEQTSSILFDKYLHEMVAQNTGNSASWNARNERVVW